MVTRTDPQPARLRHRLLRLALRIVLWPLAIAALLLALLFSPDIFDCAL
jgi:hypothetical protein